MYILLAIVLLGVLITVHEFGHFAAARLCGIPVKEYSIGFGPKLVQWKSKKHETVFSIRPIPLGGYCMFYGDTDDDPNGEKKDDPRNYNNAPVWKRMISVAAGPLMNFVLAFVVAVGLMAAYGVTIATPFRIQRDRRFTCCRKRPDGRRCICQRGRAGYDRTHRDRCERRHRQLGAGSAIDITVLRDGEQKTLTITPRYDETEERWLIGIMIQQGYEPLPAGQVIPAAWDTCVDASTAMASALGKLFTTGEGLNETSGPVGVVQLVAEQTSRAAWKSSCT